MLEVILRSGPLEGQRVKLSRKARQYVERFADKQLIYSESGEEDATTGLPKFVFQDSANETRWRTRRSIEDVFSYASA